MSDFLEVHADGVVERDALGNREIDLDLLLFLGCLLFRRRIRSRHVVDDLDPLVAESLVHIIHFVGGHILFLQCINELGVRQRTAVLLPLGKQALNDIGARCLFLLRPLCHNAVLLSKFARLRALKFKVSL